MLHSSRLTIFFWLFGLREGVRAQFWFQLTLPGGYRRTCLNRMCFVSKPRTIWRKLPQNRFRTVRVAQKQFQMDLSCFVCMSLFPPPHSLLDPFRLPQDHTWNRDCNERNSRHGIRIYICGKILIGLVLPTPPNRNAVQWWKLSGFLMRALTDKCRCVLTQFVMFDPLHTNSRSKCFHDAHNGG